MEALLIDGWGPSPNEVCVSGEVIPAPHPANTRITNPRGPGSGGVAGKSGRDRSGDVTAPPLAGSLLPARGALAESSPGGTGVRISHWRPASRVSGEPSAGAPTGGLREEGLGWESLTDAEKSLVRRMRRYWFLSKLLSISCL